MINYYRGHGKFEGNSLLYLIKELSFNHVVKSMTCIDTNVLQNCVKLVNTSFILSTARLKS